VLTPGSASQNFPAAAKKRLPHGQRTTTGRLDSSTGGSVSVTVPSSTKVQRRIPMSWDCRATYRMIDSPTQISTASSSKDICPCQDDHAHFNAYWRTILWVGGFR
jgi:hypothetical protein